MRAATAITAACCSVMAMNQPKDYSKATMERLEQKYADLAAATNRTRTGSLADHRPLLLARNEPLMSLRNIPANTRTSKPAGAAERIALMISGPGTLMNSVTGR